MIRIPKHLYQRIAALAVCSILLMLGSCTKNLAVPYPINSLSTATAFNNRSTIDGMVNNLYIQFTNQALSAVSLRYMPGLADEGYNPTTSDDLMDACTNHTTPQSNIIPNWDGMYSTIYTANMLLENIPGSTASGFTDNMKKSYLAAVKTIRAFVYFQLVREFGGVPLVVSTDVPVNSLTPRETVATVYAFIEKDLKEAMADLPAETGAKYYFNNKYMPEAILAEVYLTEGKWDLAETAASDIIHSGKYELTTVTDVFLQSTNEGIVLVAPVYSGNNDNSFKLANSAYLTGLPQGFSQTSFEFSSIALSPDLLASFEPGDQRLLNWVTLSNTGDYPDTASRMFCYKYKYNSVFFDGTVAPGTEEEDKIIRLAEIYLIRAEARAELNNLGGAKEDLDIIRTRAGLGGTNAASQDAMIQAVLNERRHELFFEGGWRWYDLVRTGRANAVLSVIPYKVNWKPYMILFPLSLPTVNANPNLTQTPGY